MNPRELYEQKILSDPEFPVQMHINDVNREGWYFQPHWHEHIELHFVLEGEGTFEIGQKKIRAQKGTLVIANGNELHAGYCDGSRIRALVMIFEMEAFSRELADQNIVFAPSVEHDAVITSMMDVVYREFQEQALGYRLICKGMLLQLICYLTRHYAIERLSEKESIRRKKRLERLNTVLQYMQEHYSEPVSNAQLAELVHLSEDRFNHLFRESMEVAPLQYLNEVRLKKAHNLLKNGNTSIAEVAAEVGFTDYNHFGRLFKRYYHCTPSEASGK